MYARLNHLLKIKLYRKGFLLILWHIFKNSSEVIYTIQSPII